MNIFAPPLLVTGTQHARLLVNNTPETVPGKLVITADGLRFDEYSKFDVLFDCFSPLQGTPPKSADSFKEFFPGENLGELFSVKQQSPPKSFAYSIASDISSISVVMVSDGEYRRTHPDYTHGSASILEQPKACISIVLKSGEQVMICPLPKTDRITQEEYAHYLVSLIGNTGGERTPNTDIPCKCCGKVLSSSQQFCDCCGTPIHVVRRLSARDGVERKIKISLMKGNSADFSTDRGERLSFRNKQSMNARVLKVLSPRMVLCIVTPNDARRLEISAGGDGELQVYADKTSDRITSIKCKGKISVLWEDIADPSFLYYGDIAMKPARPYGEHDNLLLIDP